MSREGRLRSFSIVGLLNCLGLDDSVFIGEGVWFGRGVKGGPMLGYPALEVNSATHSPLEATSRFFG